MVTLETADNALKSFYLDAVTEALDMKTNPLLAKIQRSTADVVGKDVRKFVKCGVNGGINAGSETGGLPKASSGERLQFVAPLKNLYGTIEISDKAIRASANSEGAFVNLLNDEMQDLIKSASFNFGRMLYGDGTGAIARIQRQEENILYVDNIAPFVEGMVVDISDYFSEELIEAFVGIKIVKVDREKKCIHFEDENFHEYPNDLGYVYINNSRDYEITGLGAIFNDKPLYGVDRKAGSIMNPYKKTNVGEINESVIQLALDKIEESSGSQVNFIVCSWGVRRALINYFRTLGVAMPTLEFEGGFKALSFNGIPIVVDRFCPVGTMYFLNTDDFKLCQLCDWKWLEGEDGKILKQIPGKPVYTATLVKYAELMCTRPNGQGMLSGITEA